VVDDALDRAAIDAKAAGDGALAAACVVPGSVRRPAGPARLGLLLPGAIAETGPVTERVRVRETDEDEGRRLVPGAATTPTTNGYGGSAAGQTQLDAALVRRIRN
jgi:hypothetical protein